MTNWFPSLFFRPSVWTQMKNGGRSLQCHLDVNGVILGQETIGGKITPTEEYASIILANGTDGKWGECQKSQSYKTYVWEYLHPGPNSSSQLRETRKQALKQFVRTLSTDRHPLAQSVEAQYQQIISLLDPSPIFPGFPHLIRTLQTNHISHNFIFRTFAEDGERVKKYLEEQFPNMVLQQASFDQDAGFHYQKGNKEIVTKDRNEFSKLIKTGHWLIKDNFERWRTNQEQGNYGKLFPFSSDPQDPVLSIFADDNLEFVASGEERTIVCCYDTATQKLVNTQQASPHLIKINPVKAVLEQDYLTTRVSQAAEQLLNASRSRIPFLKIAVVAAVLIASLLAYAYD
ncbi:MAG: hypothetical protein WCF19_02500 [Chlamydiales bacterium]